MSGVESIEALRSALAWNVPADSDDRRKSSRKRSSDRLTGVSVLIKPFLAEELLQLMTRLFSAVQYRMAPAERL